MGIDLKDYVALRTLPRSIDGECYNRVRLALVRLDDPLRIELPRFRLEFVLQRKVWMGLSLVNELPVLAWTGFCTRKRALHEPVPCELHLYHIHAGLLMSTALEAMDGVLKKRLTQLQAYRAEHQA